MLTERCAHYDVTSTRRNLTLTRYLRTCWTCGYVTISHGYRGRRFGVYVSGAGTAWAAMAIVLGQRSFYAAKSFGNRQTCFTPVPTGKQKNYTHRLSPNRPRGFRNIYSAAGVHRRLPRDESLRSFQEQTHNSGRSVSRGPFALPLYGILFFCFFFFYHAIKAVADVEKKIAVQNVFSSRVKKKNNDKNPSGHLANSATPKNGQGSRRNYCDPRRS